MGIERNTWALATTAVVVAMVGSLSCGDDGQGSGDDGIAPGFERAELLSSLADRAIVPTLQAFADRAAELQTAAQAYAESVGSDDEATRLQEVRAAWQAAAEAWQVADVMQVGPAAAGGASGRTGGLGLRTQIYSWPFDNPCRVDQEVVANLFAQDGFFEGKLDNTFGLDALEYLYFYEDDANQCPPQVDINSNGLWNDLVSSGLLTERRADYATAVAVKLKADADRLLQEWTGGFADQLANAGQSGSPYRSAQAAIDEVFAAMYYLELQTVDAKLGAPAGFNARCLEETCPDLAESPWADRGREFIRRNVEGFALMFHGGLADDPSAVGFDDYLEAAGAGDLADRLTGLLEAARTATQDVEPSLRVALTSARTELETQYDAVSELMILVETEFVSDLALEIPREGAADND